MKTEVQAIMFTDLVGYTARTSSQSHEQNAEMLKKLGEVVHPLVKHFGGRVIKEIGDGVLSVFDAATSAVQAAMAIQDRLAELNAGGKEADQLRLRIAINVGEVRVERRDVFGDAVNIAARIESQTPAGEIHVSEATVLTMNKVGIPLKAVGLQEFKGISEPVLVYSIPAAPKLAETGTRPDTLPYMGRQLAELRRYLRRRRFKIVGAAAAAVLLCVGAGYVTQQQMAHRGDVASVRTAIEAGDFVAAAEGLAALHAAGAEIDVELTGLMARLGAVSDPFSGCAALDRIDFAVNDRNREALARLRLAQVFGLIELGELAEARACLADVNPEELITGHRLFELSQIHLDSLEALNNHRAGELRKALARYEDFLRAGAAPDAHLAFIASIAVQGYRYRASRPVADSLVVEFLGDAAVRPLAGLASDSDTNPTPRAWVIARLEEIVGADSPAIDWVSIYAAVLDREASSTCGMRRSAIDGLKSMNSLAVVGILAREAARRDRCTRDLARHAADELVATGTLAVETRRNGPVIVASR